MSSAAFSTALEATGYLDTDGRTAPGLTVSGDTASARLRTVLHDQRVGLEADAVFSAQGAPTSIFKDAGLEAPTSANLRGWYEAAWNVGVAPLLWIITPTDVRLYDCYSVPPEMADDAEPPELGRFRFNTSESTVEKWETGAKRPSGMALKLLTIVRKHGLQILM